MNMKYLVLPCALMLASSVFAKEVSVPFHRAVPAEGLVINYNVDGKYPQKVLCVFSHFYKGYLKYTENAAEKEAPAFGDGKDAQQVYLSNKGQTWENTQGGDNLQQFHVDAKGNIMVKNTPYRSSKAHATCIYIPEDSK